MWAFTNSHVITPKEYVDSKKHAVVQQQFWRPKNTGTAMQDTHP